MNHLHPSGTIIIDNGAGGTNRKVAASRLKTYAGFSGAAFPSQTLT